MVSHLIFIHTCVYTDAEVMFTLPIHINLYCKHDSSIYIRLNPSVTTTTLKN